MTVCICTAFDTGFASLAEITLPVLVRYCARHGYALRTEMNPPGDIYWKRTEMVLNTLQEFDAAVWMDTDALVTNHTETFDGFLNQFKNATICASTDRNGINDGVLIARAHPNTNLILEAILSLDGQAGIHAPQDALQRLYDERQTPGMHVFRNKLFNAFPPEGEGDTWEPGDFILQMPGCNRERRIELAKATIPQIIW